VHKDDSTLVSEVRQGSHASFEQLMERHQNQVYRVAYSYARNVEQALDIAQNVFIKAYENLHKFRGESQFKTWLLRITYNESQNWLKKNLRYKSEEDVESLVNQTQTMLNQEDELLAKENRALLLHSLYELNTRYRLAVVLRYFENYTIKEIAQVLHCSEGMIKNMLFRSLQKMKNNLQHILAGEYQ
jgi:RNA polymerase sigma-70 factor (ECF subfamily)